MPKSISTDDRTQWRAVVLALLAALVAVSHLSKTGLALPDLRQDMQLGMVTAGWIASIFSLTGIGLGLASGTIVDHLGQRHPLIAGLALLALGSLVGSYSTSGEILLITRTIEGIGFIAVTVSVPVLVIRASADKNRKMNVTLWSMCLPIGSAVVLFVSPLIIETLGWRGVWQVTGWLTLIVFIVVAWGLREVPLPPRPANTHQHGNIRRTLSVPGPWLAASAFGFFAILQQSMSVWLPTFLIEQHGVATALAGSLTAVFFLFNGAGNSIAGVLMSWGARRWVLLLTAGLGTGLTAIGAFSSFLPNEARFLFVLAFSCVGGLLPATIFAASSDYAPSPAQIGTFNGLIMVGISVGQFTGPPAMAAVVSWAGTWDVILWYIIALSLILTTIALLARRLDKSLEQKP